MVFASWNQIPLIGVFICKNFNLSDLAALIFRIAEFEVHFQFQYWPAIESVLLVFPSIPRLSWQMHDTFCKTKRASEIRQSVDVSLYKKF